MTLEFQARPGLLHFTQVVKKAVEVAWPPPTFPFGLPHLPYPPKKNPLSQKSIKKKSSFTKSIKKNPLLQKRRVLFALFLT
jgi:hypothetical protein